MSISTRASIACHIEVCEVLDISEYHAKSFNMNATSCILFFYVKFNPRLEGMGIVRLPCFGTRIGGMNLLLEVESKNQVDTPLALRCAAEFIGTFLPFFSVGYILSEFCNSSLYHLLFALMDFFWQFYHDLFFPLFEVSMSFPGLQYLVDCPWLLRCRAGLCSNISTNIFMTCQSWPWPWNPDQLNRKHSEGWRRWTMLSCSICWCCNVLHDQECPDLCSSWTFWCKLLTRCHIGVTSFQFIVFFSVSFGFGSLQRTSLEHAGVNASQELWRLYMAQVVC